MFLHPVMSFTTRTLCLAGCMVLSLAGSSWGAAYDARVRWQPSRESGITGYRVWVRPANGSYGAPRDAGMPSMASDGSYSLLVNNLDSRTD